MLAKRSIVLTTVALLPEPILRREAIADSLLAQDVLAHAQRQAEQLLARYQAEAEQANRQALAQFWSTANAFLGQLQLQQEALQQQALDAAEEVLAQALRQLLDETTLAERARALVRNLAASQLNETAATLSVHPDMAEALDEWLAQSRFAECWRLSRDASLPMGSLRLSDAHGAFDIDWASLREGLLGAPAPA